MFAVNSFNGFLSRDRSYNDKQENTYYDALDIRLYNKKGLTEGSAMTFKGTAPFATLPDRSTEIIGSVDVRDAMVVFTVNVETGESSIWKSPDEGGMILLYSDIESEYKLNFSTEYRIHGSSKRDNQYSEKVYWTDGYNVIRSINIIEDVLGKEASYFNLYPPFESSTIQASVSDSEGSLKTGRVQYFVRYFNKYGSETTISAISNIVSLSKYLSKSSWSTKGTDSDEISNRSVYININDIDTSFSNLSIYRVLYTSVNNVPEIYLISQSDINKDYYEFLDTGNNEIDSLTIEEFNSILARGIIANAVTSHNTSLMLGGITDKSFDVDVDCRAYSYAHVDGVAKSILGHESDSKYGTLTINSDGSWSIDGGQSGTSIDTIPKDHDCINYSTNLYAISDKWRLNFDEIQMYSNATLASWGGSGSVVSYELDNGSYRLIEGDATYYDSVYSTSISGHKRGEVYRYGIVLYDENGIKSQVKWVSDIIIPYVTGFTTGGGDDGYEYYYTNVNSLVVQPPSNVIDANIVNIKFNIDFSKLPSNVSHVQIVRVKRSKKDITSVQGVITKAASFTQDDFTDAGVETEMSYFDENVVYPLSYMYDDMSIRIHDRSYAGGLTVVDMDISSRNDAGSYFVFNSPDVSINNYEPLSRNSKLITLSYNTYSDKANQYIDRVYNTINHIAYSPFASFPDSSNPKSILYTSDIADFSNIGGEDVYGQKSLAGKNISAGLTNAGSNVFLYENANNSYYKYSSVSYGLTPKSIMLKVYNTDANDVMLDFNYTVTSDIISDNFNVRYNGYTNFAKTTNEYVPVSGFIKNNSTLSSVAVMGDSYTTMYEQILSTGFPFTPAFNENLLSKQAELEADGKEMFQLFYTQQVVFTFPLESMVNSHLMNMHLYPLSKGYGDSYIKTVNPSIKNDTLMKTVFIQENRNTGIEKWPEYYPKDLPEHTYTYNTAYSIQPEYPKSFMLNPIYDTNDYFPSRIIASKPYARGSIVDNWSVFDFSEDIDVGSENGVVNSLVSFRNKLYYFQDNAFGVIASKDRSVITDKEGAQLSLGSGGILERYDKLLTGVGVSHPSHVVKGVVNLFFIDFKRKQIIDVMKPYIPLADVTKNASLISDMMKNVNHVNDITLGYDPEYKEYLFTLGEDTVAYNEITMHFTSRYSAVPTIYLNTDRYLYSFINYEDIGINRYLFKHNAGRFGAVYSEVLGRREKYAYVSFLLNPNGIFLFEPNNVIYKADVYDGDNAFPAASPRSDRSLAEIVIKNHYTEIATPIYLKNDGINTANTANIAGEWRTQLNLTHAGNRMAAPYQLMTLRFDNTQNQFLVLSSVITDYMQHKI